MRAAAIESTMPDMEHSGRRRLILEIDLKADPIAGSITDERGDRPFAGWLELATALEAVVHGSRDSALAGDTAGVEKAGAG